MLADTTRLLPATCMEPAQERPAHAAWQRQPRSVRRHRRRGDLDHQNAKELIRDADSAMYQRRTQPGPARRRRPRHFPSWAPEQPGTPGTPSRRARLAVLPTPSSRSRPAALSGRRRSPAPLGTPTTRAAYRPETFINLAERSGRSAPSEDGSSTEHAQLAAWQRQLGDLAPQRVFVNLSPREIADMAPRQRHWTPRGRATDLWTQSSVQLHGFPAFVPHSPNTTGADIPRRRRLRHRLLLARLIDSPVLFAIDRSLRARPASRQATQTLIEAIAIAHQLEEPKVNQEQVIDLTAARL